MLELIDNFKITLINVREFIEKMDIIGEEVGDCRIMWKLLNKYIYIYTHIKNLNEKIQWMQFILDCI